MTAHVCFPLLVGVPNRYVTRAFTAQIPEALSPVRAVAKTGCEGTERT